MRRPLKATAAAMFLLALTLSACSGASSSSLSGITVAFKSPAIHGSSLPALYTCSGRDISPPMEWGAVPSTSRELVVFVLGLTPHPSTGGYLASVQWVIAGVNPALHKLAAGELPAGAHLGIVGTAKKGYHAQHYSICPAKGKTARYQFALYSVPAGLSIPKRFVGFRLLELLANPESQDKANAGGAFVVTYKRK